VSCNRGILYSPAVILGQWIDFQAGSLLVIDEILAFPFPNNMDVGSRAVHREVSVR